MNKKDLLKILFNPVGEAKNVVEKANARTKRQEKIIQELLKKNKKK